MSELSARQWAEALNLLDEALELPIGEREAWLLNVPPPVLPTVRALLAERRALETGNFLNALPPLALAGQAFSAGRQYGPYTLLRELGQGGMASVWLAERTDHEHQRKVALKLPWLGPRAHAVSERFARERRLLSSLEHPHIAGVLDAGTEAGQPWLAMEFVDGEPLTRWADAKALDVRARLTLLLQVLGAVQHAHTQLVIHRDLKPANVLVDSRGQVKLLDFGIAKLLDDDGETARSQLTEAGGRALTPQYASPEQLAGKPLATTSDVYSLGVVAYELLTGQLPYVLERGSPQAMELAVMETSVKPPSTVTARRGLRGDVDTMVLKALEFDPRRRYGSVEAFAKDLERHLASQPIEARPSSVLYRLSRLWARNRIVATATLVATLALVIGLGVALWQTRTARQQARRAEAAKSFLVSVFRGSDVRVARDKPRGSITAKELLDENVDRIDTAFPGDVDTQLEMLALAGEIYGHLGEAERSEALFHRRSALALATFGKNHPALIEGQLYDAWGAIEAQRYAEALATLDDTRQTLDANGLTDELLGAEYWLARGEALRASGTGLQRLEAYERAVAIYERLDPHADSLIAALANAGTVLLEAERLLEARAHYQRALDVAKVAVDRDDTAMAMLWGNLAVIQRELGDPSAIVSVGEAEKLARTTGGEDDSVYWYQAARRALWASEDGDRESSNRLFEALLKHVPDDWERNTAHAMVWAHRGEALLAQGDAAAALPWLERAERIYVARPYRESDLRQLRSSLGMALAELGETERARAVLTSAREDFVAHEAVDSSSSLAMRERWARFLIDCGERDAAKTELDAILEVAKEPSIGSALAWADRARLAMDAKDFARAVEHATRSARELTQVKSAYDVRVRARVALTHAAALLASGEDGRALATEALATLERTDAPASPLLARARRLANRP